MIKNFIKTSVLLLLISFVSIPVHSQEISKDKAHTNSVYNVNSTLSATQVRCYKCNSNNDCAVIRCPE